MHYVGGNRAETGCVFCNRLASDDDVASLILERGDHCFTIMNLFPYNTGHVMTVPNRHLAGPEELDDATTVEMARAVPRTIQALRRALNPAGFNLGTNVGAVSGAGIAAHLHQHVVPRWQGDANFMPILAGTMVLPELIPVTYAKVRAELERSRATEVVIVAFDRHRTNLLVSAAPRTSARLPFAPVTESSVWKSAAAHLEEIGHRGVLTGWAGPNSTRSAGQIALSFEIGPVSEANQSLHLLPIDRAMSALSDADRRIVQRALRIGPSSIDE